MKIELVNDASFLKDDVFKETYNLVTFDKMGFQSCLLVNNVLLFILKDPQRLFTVEKVKNSYNFKMEGEEDNFEYMIDESEVGALIEKFRKRQVFG